MNEKITAEAQFSVNIINLFNPPKPLVLGSWNKRELNMTEANKLKDMMTRQGIKAYTMENMIPIVIERHHVDQACIWSGMSGYGAPPLQLSEEGMQEIKGLLLAGGRHRIAAVKALRAEANAKLQALRVQIKEAAERKTTATEDDDEVEVSLDQMKIDEEGMVANMTANEHWGVVLYDHGEYDVENEKTASD